jgi:hypothetical protein
MTDDNLDELDPAEDAEELRTFAEGPADEDAEELRTFAEGPADDEVVPEPPLSLAEPPAEVGARESGLEEEIREAERAHQASVCVGSDDVDADTREQYAADLAEALDLRVEVNRAQHTGGDIRRVGAHRSPRARARGAVDPQGKASRRLDPGNPPGRTELMAQIGTRKLKIEVDGTEYTADVSNTRITSAAADSDFVSFAQAAAGGARAYQLAGTAAQDAVADSFWDVVYSQAGADLDVTIMPYGNPVPSTTEPHFTTTITVGEPDGDFLGGEANASTTAKMTFDFAFDCTRPVRVTTAG